MKNNLKQEIDEYISQWHYDEKTNVYSFELGKFLFGFINYLNNQKLSDRTKKRHIDNVYSIGLFDVGYNYNDVFSIENLEDGPHNVIEFEIKVSDSDSAVKSYEATYNKLDKYIKSGEYKKYLAEIEKEIDNINI